MDPVEARALFPVTDDVIYLQHAGSALVSTRSKEAVSRVAQRLLEPGWGKSCDDEQEQVRGAIAWLIRANPDEIAFTRGTAQGLSLLRGLDWQPGDNLVSVRGEYPANIFPWITLEHRGVELRPVELDQGRVNPDALFEAVDSKTRAITLSWIQWWNGFRADIAAIGEECRRRNILFAVDAIQGVGAIRLDLSQTPVDLLACGGTKWLMGTPGTGFVFVREGVLDQIVPPFVGVGSMVVDSESPFEDQREFKPSARRYEESAVSWYDTAALGAAVGLINEVGIEQIEDRVLSLSSYLGTSLAQLGFKMAEPWPRERHESSGIVSIHPGTSAEETLQLLREAGIVARRRPGLIRFSTHFMNTESELDAVIDFMRNNIKI